jgi:exopolysaccharide production protein ExoQ
VNRGRIGAYSLAVVAALAAPSAVLAPNALGVLLIVGGIGGLIAWRLPARGWLLGFGAFIAYALLTLLWTIDPAEGFDGWVRISLGAVFGLAMAGNAASLDDADRARVERWLVFGTAAAIALLLAQLASQQIFGFNESFASRWHGPDTNLWALLNRPVGVLAIMLPLGVLAAYRVRGAIAAIAMLAAGVFCVANFNSMGAELAVAAAAGAAIFAGLFVKRGATILTLGLAAGILAAPLIASAPQLEALAQRRDVTVSIFHRAAIWHFTAGKILERPALGWGMHASRTMPEGKVQFAPGAELLPLHPHNAALQIWLELGLAGAIAAAAAILALGRRIRGDRFTRAALAGALLGAFTVGSVGYGIWQGWWMGALWILVALAAALTPPKANA